MANGKFITMEGGEGSGKSTQTALLTEKLRAFGIVVLQTREPGGTPRAEAIRDIVLSGKARHLGAAGEAALFYAARESHLQLAIRPALVRGDWVVCDRFSDSTRAYQGAAGGVSKAMLDTLEAVVVGETRPDLTIIFDIPPEEGLQRIHKRNGNGVSSADDRVPDRFETMNLAFHRSLREGFLDTVKAEPERCAVVDATPGTREVAERVWSIVRERFRIGKA